jgi:hypothetical protein
MSQYPPTPSAPPVNQITPSAPPNNQLALTSLITGIVAWVLWVILLCFNFIFSGFTAGLTLICGFLPLIPWGIAVATGHMGLSQISRTAEGGRGMAIAGLIMGYLGLALTLCTIGLAILAALGLISFFALGSLPTPSVP